MVKLTAEINDRMKGINATKSWFFEKINNIDKYLMRGEKKTQISDT